MSAGLCEPVTGASAACDAVVGVALIGTPGIEAPVAARIE
jgi:hypothetical protein